MTIDEAIAYAREKAKYKKTKYDKCPTRMRYCCEMCFHKPKCNEVAKEHKQLAEWLEELKILREEKSEFQIIAKDIAEYNYEMGMENGYNKAIDDFVKEICKMIVQSENNGNYRFYAVEIKQAIADLAEQLKAGGKNE